MRIQCEAIKNNNQPLFLKKNSSQTSGRVDAPHTFKGQKQTNKTTGFNIKAGFNTHISKYIYLLAFIKYNVAQELYVQQNTKTNKSMSAVCHSPIFF